MSFEDILLNVMRPARYIGREHNAVNKNPARIKFNACLCFPELYDIGMSNLGIRILYDILNSRKDLACERAFCPWPDYQKVLKDNSLKLTSLESGTPLGKFDLLGFSVNNELNYTNILSMFSLSGIPFTAKERGAGFPLIIAGGNCSLNPEPIADFFDLIVIGEAEEVIVDIVKICTKFKEKYGRVCARKEELLIELSKVPGIYVPQFYNVEYDKDMTVKEFTPGKNGIPSVIKKVYVKNLDKCLRPLSWIVPNIEVIHDRIGIEIMRGCPHRCRFCQAHSYFSPLRIRSPKVIFNLAKRLYKVSGYEQISLLSLSSSDYPFMEGLVGRLIKYFSRKAVSIALPSVRPKNITENVSRLLSSQRKTGLTFAPEAGTDRLRRIINKDINIEELFQAARGAYKAGYQRIKLYFMIGLPKENDSDLEAIVDLASKLSYLRKDFARQAAQISLSISTFIPKPHTPFQWLNMSRMDETRRKQGYLKKLILSRPGLESKIKINFHNVHISVVEAALSRGHRGLSKVIQSAFDKGAQFDQWSDCFNFDIWQQAFSENGFDIEESATRSIALEKTLPWDFIDMGINKEFLKDEFRKALT
ncbi:MAG: TIGR03960 family B12-binding radical SAM protein [Candidatus Omnitrophica bacterium]|nr:TIGR03960 family B12-binding radical SAM protein [Candidatus Omnitrophota bacterium]